MVVRHSLRQKFPLEYRVTERGDQHARTKRGVNEREHKILLVYILYIYIYIYIYIRIRILGSYLGCCTP